MFLPLSPSSQSRILFILDFPCSALGHSPELTACPVSLPAASSPHSLRQDGISSIRFLLSGSTETSTAARNSSWREVRLSGNKGSGNGIPIFPCAAFPYLCCVKLWTLHFIGLGFLPLTHHTSLIGYHTSFHWLIIPFPLCAEEETHSFHGLIVQSIRSPPLTNSVSPNSTPRRVLVHLHWKIAPS